MSLVSRLVGRVFQLPPADTYNVAVERDLKVPMPDGVNLLADHYYPRERDRLATLLVRSPYGRTGFFGLIFGRLFAERGFQVLVQSVRGTFGSGGQFESLRNERADGLATVEWLNRQPWFSGEFATVGPSYLGIVQWAIAAEAGPQLKAMAPQITASEFRSLTYPGGSFALDTTLTWIYQLAHQEQSPLTLLLSLVRSARVLRPTFAHLPLCEAANIVAGRPIPFFRDWLEHDQPGDEWWKPVDFTASVSRVTAPVHLIGGWYDIFLPQMLGDYARLRQAGRQPYLTIGPWVHTSQGLMPVALRESLAWFHAHLLGDSQRLRTAPVRIFVMGGGEWKEMAAWPPDDYRAQPWYLQAGRVLSTAPSVGSEPDRYRYDPTDPTPAVGGSSLSQNSGPKDNRALEARPDVLSYTSAPLERDLEIIGPVRAELYFRSSLEHTDLFARLCDVDPSGKSINICDGLQRLWPGYPAPQTDGCLKVALDLWPTAYRFQRGHRIRLQVSSGAHPRFARNTGSGEPLATATKLIAADQTVYHDPMHPSAILLPVCG